MPEVVTAAATIQCIHTGTVTVTPSVPKFSVADKLGNQSPVLLVTDINTAVIVGCKNIGPGLKPCTKPLPPLVGASLKLTSGGKPVLLSTANGLTDSTPPGTWTIIKPGQTKLTAS